MKKNIKDLKADEIWDICEKYFGRRYCSGCPLNAKELHFCKNGLLNKYGEEEIEVNE